jgi:hypothetical protein
MPSNDWEVGTMYNGGRLNGTPFFTQEGGPFTPVSPALPQGAPWPDWPGSGSMVFSYGPWIGIGCLHSIHEFNVIQDVDNTQDPPALVSLLTCPVCSYIQRAITNQSIYGPTGAYDPLVAAVLVA